MELKLFPTWGSSEKHRRSQKCLIFGRGVLGTRMVHNKNGKFSFFGGSSCDVLYTSLSSLLGFPHDFFSQAQQRTAAGPAVQG